VCDEWDRVLKGLGTLRSQYPREEMARFTQCVQGNYVMKPVQEKIEKID